MKALATLNPSKLDAYTEDELSDVDKDIIKEINNDINKKEKQLERIKSDSKISKDKKTILINNLNEDIFKLSEQKDLIFMESKEKTQYFEMKAAQEPSQEGSQDFRDPANILEDKESRREGMRVTEVDKTSEATARELRQARIQERIEAKKVIEEKIAAGEITAENVPEIPKANIVVADSQWGQLSNLSANSFTFDGREYRSVEHAYQTLKSGKFHEQTYRAYFDRPQAMKIASGPPANKTTNIQLMEDLYRQMLTENPETLELLNKTEGMKITHILGSGKEGVWGREMPRILNKLRNEFATGTPEVKAQTFETVKMYSVADVQANPDKIYIFGDNTEGWGKGGQAIIRDESNAFGISTKDSPNQFMSDDNFEANKARIDADIAAIKADGRPIVFPEDGIGTGRADLENKAPQTWAYLQERLEELKGGTPDVKGETVYNTIDNPQGQNHYVNRTKYNYANSDITFDFTTGGPSGAGHSAGKGTPDYMKKWNGIKVDNVGRLDMNNIDKVAQKLADALTSGQTINIAGHGNYSSTRGGLTGAVPQSQIDGTVKTIFNRAKELAGDKPITGKIISGGQSGFDEAGIRVARNLGIPTEVNVTEYTWRDATGERVNAEEEFKTRIDSDGKVPSGPGTPSIDDPAFDGAEAINDVDKEKGGDGKFARYAIYLIDPISELIEDGAIKLAAAAGFPKLARAIIYLMYYEAANLVGTVIDAIPEAANQAALAQMDQSMILGAGLGLVDEEAFDNWKEDLNSATAKNLEGVQEDMYQMFTRSPLSRGWYQVEETFDVTLSPWQWEWVRDIINPIIKIGANR